MLLKEFLPAIPFREFVKCFRIVHFQFETAAAVPIKVYPPKPEVCLHFFLCNGEDVEGKNGKFHSHPVVLTGQHTTLIKRHVCTYFLDFQIVFQPTAVFRLTGVPAYEFTNKYLDAELLFPKHIIAMTIDKMKNAKGNYNDLLLLGDYFMALLLRNSLKSAHPIDATAKMMLLYNGKTSLDHLAKQSCLSNRQFERRFLERVGTHPKTYIKIIRSNRAFNIRNAFPHRDWLDIALDCRYYDHQHLAKDCKELTGLTPTALHLAQENSPESKLHLTDELYKERAQQ